MDNLFQRMAGNKVDEERKRKRELERNRLKEEISTKLASRTKDMVLFGATDKQILKKIENDIDEILEMSNTMLPLSEQEKIKETMILEITGLGKIDYLMRNEKVSEVMINANDEVWIEQGGKLQRTDVVFEDDEEVLQLARKIVGFVGRRVDNNEPIADARLPDGSRVHIVLKGIALKGTTVTIRKFSKNKLTIKNLIAFGSIDEKSAEFLGAAVRGHANIIVSGGTGSGKTTTLNIVSNFVPDEERIITIEDSAELQLNNSHVVSLESRPKNAEGEGEVSIRDLVKASLRMRPDRVIVGEVRDGTAYDLLQAMNTGHDGSMATIHSNSPSNCVGRLSNLILQAGFDFPDRAIKEIVAESVDIIVQIKRLRDGSRKITNITEIAGFDGEKVIVNDIFRWELEGIKDGKLQGRMKYTGYKISENLRDKFEQYGLDFDALVEGAEQ